MNATSSLLAEKDLRQLIARNETEQALAALHAHLQAYDLPGLQDDLALQSAKWESYEDHRLAGTLGADALSQHKAQLDLALLAINRQLFQQLETARLAAPPSAQSGNAGAGTVAKPAANGIREDKFKIQVFVLMILTKAAVIGWVFFHQSSGGLSQAQALATTALLLPTFSMYVAAMFNEFLENRHVTDKQTVQPYVKNSLRWLSYALFPTYAFLLMNVIGTCAQQYAGQENAMEELGKWLGLIETGLGVYIGKLVFALFKAEK